MSILIINWNNYIYRCSNAFYIKKKNLYRLEPKDKCNIANISVRDRTNRSIWYGRALVEYHPIYHRVLGQKMFSNRQHWEVFWWVAFWIKALWRVELENYSDFSIYLGKKWQKQGDENNICVIRVSDKISYFISLLQL